MRLLPHTDEDWEPASIREEFEYLYWRVKIQIRAWLDEIS